MTFGLRAANTREKAAAVNLAISNGTNVVAPPRIDARALAMAAMLENFTSERPMMATRNEPTESCERVFATLTASEPEPMMTMSARI